MCRHWPLGQTAIGKALHRRSLLQKKRAHHALSSLLAYQTTSGDSPLSSRFSDDVVDRPGGGRSAFGRATGSASPSARPDDRWRQDHAEFLGPQRRCAQILRHRRASDAAGRPRPRLYARGPLKAALCRHVLPSWGSRHAFPHRGQHSRLDGRIYSLPALASRPDLLRRNSPYRGTSPQAFQRARRSRRSAPGPWRMATWCCASRSPTPRGHRTPSLIR